VKYLTYVVRNAKRNPVRSFLTIASTGVSLFLMMILASFFTVNDHASASARVYNRVVTLNSQGFAGMIPIVRVREVAAMDGVVAATPFSWFGGKFGEERLPFAQFGVDPQTFFTVYDEFTMPADQIKAWQEDRAGCIIGRKLAADRGLKVGDPLPLKGDAYAGIDLNLTIRGVYDGPPIRDLRMCLFQWDYFDELRKLSSAKAASGNAGCIVVKCKSGDSMASTCRKIDTAYLNTDNPTRTQTEEAFSKLFVEMLGDLRGVVRWIGMAVVASLILVSGNALAMALRERTTEVAVLKAIGFGGQLVLFLVLAEAMIVSGFGGVLGALGSKALFEAFDISRFTMGFLPFFYIPWPTAAAGLALSVLIGFASGIVPAVRAANLSVVDGLRKVV
jgi:putative ABC transport system permease protein